MICTEEEKNKTQNKCFVLSLRKLHTFRNVHNKLKSSLSFSSSSINCQPHKSVVVIMKNTESATKKNVCVCAFLFTRQKKELYICNVLNENRSYFKFAIYKAPVRNEIYAAELKKHTACIYRCI